MDPSRAPLWNLLVVLTLACHIATAADTTWSLTGSLSFPRRDHTATLLPNGRVLIVGHLTNVAELYDPSTGTFTAVGKTVFTHGQRGTATLLPDGKVLIAGGFQAPQSAETYDPATNRFTATSNPVLPHYSHTATLLKTGRVLIAGGMDPNRTQAAAEIYDPQTGLFQRVGDMTAFRENHTATLLADGRVLLASGR